MCLIIIILSNSTSCTITISITEVVGLIIRSNATTNQSDCPEHKCKPLDFTSSRQMKKQIIILSYCPRNASERSHVIPNAHRSS